ncbi:3-mercaptopyruvate sulfurtransferase SseA, contains two rhodanese domains [Malonomonas rubra DSM 5091]|uniref:3-mercaptopyruvate sulfurtransferase SseA, contains two rhodanese domains n=1 Tax=Malonomonas rubra DSM 5091 TaxID=1122189 RepID=A0A1M6M1G9_MALRU|nr:rhodanese-like domain-containing protein [Malonomonas rubra]SHJ77312.1 3-mercaptopyruvate sulfurtransferase SseA, contains two rhodanese domains [Malonomonas rubra DSM 5091]
MRRLALFLAGILAVTFLVTGCQTTAKTAPVTDKAAAEVKKNVPQDPKLRITTVEVMDLFAKEFGDSPLVKETLDANKTFQLIDARPAVKYEAGHVPGAISIPKPMLEKNLDKLAKDKMLIFYCGGLHCKLSPQSAEIAMKAGFKNVKVWYEGQPGWVKAGNYVEIETKAVEKLATKPSQKPYVLIDARPAVKYRKTFIPTAISLPKAEFELKKGMLPNDKSIPLIFYCGGYKCKLSHESAALALKMGYKKVSVYSAGQPDWKKAKLPLWGDEASGVKKKAVASNALPEGISVKEFKELVAAGKVTVIDVRAPDEYAAGHLPGSINIFDEDFIFKAEEAVSKMPKEGRVVLHCATGGRAGGAYYAIQDTKYTNKANLQYLDATININQDGSFTIGEGH